MTDAVQKAGAVAKDSGMSYEQLMAITASVSAHTRQNGGEIGNAMKTILTRIGKASKLSSSGEVDNATLSEASKALSNVGIDVYKPNGQFRNINTILGELSQRWGSLTDAQKRQISFAIAATRQTNVLSAILETYSQSTKLATEATNAHGNAMKNNEKWMDSSAGKIQSVKTNLSDFWIHFYNGNVVKGVLNLTKGFTALFSAISHIPAVGGLLSGGSLFALGVNRFLRGKQAFKNFNNLRKKEGAGWTSAVLQSLFGLHNYTGKSEYKNSMLRNDVNRFQKIWDGVNKTLFSGDLIASLKNKFSKSKEQFALGREGAAAGYKNADEFLNARYTARTKDYIRNGVRLGDVYDKLSQEEIKAVRLKEGNASDAANLALNAGILAGNLKTGLKEKVLPNLIKFIKNPAGIATIAAAATYAVLKVATYVGQSMNRKYNRATKNLAKYKQDENKAQLKVNKLEAQRIKHGSLNAADQYSLQSYKDQIKEAKYQQELQKEIEASSVGGTFKVDTKDSGMSWTDKLQFNGLFGVGGANKSPTGAYEAISQINKYLHEYNSKTSKLGYDKFMQKTSTQMQALMKYRDRIEKLHKAGYDVPDSVLQEVKYIDKIADSWKKVALAQNKAKSSADKYTKTVSSITGKMTSWQDLLNTAPASLKTIKSAVSKANDNGSSASGFKSTATTVLKNSADTVNGTDQFWTLAQQTYTPQQLVEWGYDYKTVRQHLNNLLPLIDKSTTSTAAFMKYVSDPKRVKAISKATHGEVTAGKDKNGNPYLSGLNKNNVGQFSKALGISKDLGIMILDRNSRYMQQSPSYTKKELEKDVPKIAGSKENTVWKGTNKKVDKAFFKDNADGGIYIGKDKKGKKKYKTYADITDLHTDDKSWYNDNNRGRVRSVFKGGFDFKELAMGNGSKKLKEYNKINALNLQAYSKHRLGADNKYAPIFTRGKSTEMNISQLIKEMKSKGLSRSESIQALKALKQSYGKNSKYAVVDKKGKVTNVGDKGMKKAVTKEYGKSDSSKKSSIHISAKSVYVNGKIKTKDGKNNDDKNGDKNNDSDKDKHSPFSNIAKAIKSFFGGKGGKKGDQSRSEFSKSLESPYGFAMLSGLSNINKGKSFINSKQFKNAFLGLGVSPSGNSLFSSSAKEKNEGNSAFLSLLSKGWKSASSSFKKNKKSLSNWISDNFGWGDVYASTGANLKNPKDKKAYEAALKEYNKTNKDNKSKVKVTADTKPASSSIKKIASKIKNLGKGKAGKIKVKADTKSAESSLKKFKSSLNKLKKPKKAKVTVNVTGKKKITSLKSALKGIKSKKAHIKVTGGESASKQVKSVRNALKKVPKSKKTKVSAPGAKQSAKQINAHVSAAKKVPPLKKTKVSAPGAPKAASDLRAVAKASHDIKENIQINVTISKHKKAHGGLVTNDEFTTTGELGKELVRTPEGQFYTVGNKGREDVPLSKGSYVFTAAQTSKILRGKSYITKNNQLTIDKTKGISPTLTNVYDAKASGGEAKSGYSLVGEEGAELIKSGDRAYLVGKNGAELTYLNKGDYVYTADETKRIMNGRSSKAAVLGDIMSRAKGTSGDWGGYKQVYIPSQQVHVVTKKKTVKKTTKKSTKKSSKKSSKKKSGKKSSSKKSKDSEPTKFDWIERAVTKIEHVLNIIDKHVESIHRTWGDREKSLDHQIKTLNEELNLQKKAAKWYKAKAVGTKKQKTKKVKVKKNGKYVTKTVKVTKGQTKKVKVPKKKNGKVVKDKKGKIVYTTKNVPVYEYRVVPKKYTSGKKKGKVVKKNGKTVYTVKKVQKKVPVYTTKGGVTYKSGKGKAKVRLEKKWKNLVINGAIKSISKNGKIKYIKGNKIQSVKDEKLAKAIQDFQDYYDKYREAKEKAEELKVQKLDAFKQKFDNVVSDYQNRQSIIEHKATMASKRNDLLQTKGRMMTAANYTAIKEANEAKLASEVEEQKKLQKKMHDYLKNGGKKNSQAWQEMTISMNENLEAQLDTKNEIAQASKNILEAQWKNFDKLQELYNVIPNEMQFLVDNLTKDGLYYELDHYYDSDIAQGRNVSEQMHEYANIGKLNNNGIAAGGLRLAKYEAYIEQAQRYKEEVEKLKEEIAADPYDLDIRSQYNTYLEGYQTAVSSANEEKEAIKSLISDGYQKQLDAINKIISARKESLQAEKDLYDYEQSMQDKQKSINSYKKQLLALQGDNSEEAQARRQTIQKNLDDAKKDMKSTQMDRLVSDQGAMLDQLYTRLQELTEKISNDTDRSIEELKNQVRGGASNIENTINKETEKWGYTVSDDTKKIISELSVTGNITNTIGNISDIQTGIEGTLQDILNTIQAYIDGVGEKQFSTWEEIKTKLYDKNGNILGRYSMDKHGYQDMTKEIKKLEQLVKEKGWAAKETQDQYAKVQELYDADNKNHDSRVAARQRTNQHAADLKKEAAALMKKIKAENDKINKLKAERKNAKTSAEKKKLDKKIAAERKKRDKLKDQYHSKEDGYLYLKDLMKQGGEPAMNYIDKVQHGSTKWQKADIKRGEKAVDTHLSNLRKDKKTDQKKLDEENRKLATIDKQISKSHGDTKKQLQKERNVLTGNIKDLQNSIDSKTVEINNIVNMQMEGGQDWMDYVQDAADGKQNWQTHPTGSDKTSSSWKAPSLLKGVSHGATNNKYKNAKTAHDMLRHRGYDVDGKNSQFKKIAKKILGHAYHNTHKENEYIRDYLKKHGFAKGGTIGDLIKGTGEDGFILARTGEEVLSIPKLKLADEMVSKLINASVAVPNMTTVTNTSMPTGNITFTVEEMNLPNVKDSKDFADNFVNVLKNDNRIQKAIRSVSVDMVNGGNTFGVRRF